MKLAKETEKKRRDSTNFKCFLDVLKADLKITNSVT